MNDLRKRIAASDPDEINEDLARVTSLFDNLPDYFRALPPPPAERLTDSLAGVGRILAMPHRLNGMPLQEAVEFAEFLGKAAIGYDRFKIGVPAVGGELDVVAIQPDGLHWYKRKSFLQKMADAREATLVQQERHRMRQAMVQIENMAKLADVMLPFKFNADIGTDTEEL